MEYDAEKSVFFAFRMILLRTVNRNAFPTFFCYSYFLAACPLLAQKFVDINSF